MVEQFDFHRSDKSFSLSHPCLRRVVGLFTSVFQFWTQQTGTFNLSKSLFLFCQHDLVLSVHPGSPSHCLRHRPPPLHHAHCHCLTEIPSRWLNVILVSSQSMFRNWVVLLLLGHQLEKIISVEHGHVGLTVNPIILKDLCRLIQSLLLEHRQPTCVFPFHHYLSNT